MSEARGRRPGRSSARGPSPPSSEAGRLLLGDNLEVLRALSTDPAVRGRVRLVYIDPPFATGRRFAHERGEGAFAYDDQLTGTSFLAFLRERVQLLRELLSEDGSLYVHIDVKVGHRVRALLDEVFGEERFVNQITRIKCNPKNFSRPAYGNITDLILFYGKGARRVWHEAREAMPAEDLERLFPKVDVQGRRYTTTPLHAPGVTRSGPTGRPWNGSPPPSGRHWRYDPEVLSRLDAEGRIERSSRGNPRLKIFAEEVAARGKKRQDVWEFKDPPYPAYPTEKNLEMLRTIVRASSDPGDLVLDAFCGSGTTLVAAHQLGRRWIGIDASPAAIRAARERLRRAGARIEGDPEPPAIAPSVPPSPENARVDPTSSGPSSPAGARA
jgi:adenine-specific DNA-methyltransferase